MKGNIYVYWLENMTETNYNDFSRCFNDTSGSDHF